MVIVRWRLLVAFLCSKNVTVHGAEDTFLFFVGVFFFFGFDLLHAQEERGKKRLRSNLVKSRILSFENQLLPYSLCHRAS